MWLLIRVVLVAAVILVVLAVLRRRGTGPEITVANVSDAVAQLCRQGKDGAFLVLMLPSPQVPGRDPLNVQYSIEGGRLGLDWVLVSDTNVAEAQRVGAFIRERGHTVAEKEMNGVRYLRVEDGDVVRLGLAILDRLYGLDGGARVGTVMRGFRWKSGAGSPMVR